MDKSPYRIMCVHISSYILHAHRSVANRLWPLVSLAPPNKHGTLGKAMWSAWLAVLWLGSRRTLSLHSLWRSWWVSASCDWIAGGEHRVLATGGRAQDQSGSMIMFVSTIYYLKGNEHDSSNHGQEIKHGLIMVIIVTVITVITWLFGSDGFSSSQLCKAVW